MIKIIFLSLSLKLKRNKLYLLEWWNKIYRHRKSIYLCKNRLFFLTNYVKID